MSVRKGSFAAVLTLALCSAAAAQPSAPPAKPAPSLDPKAAEILRQMCDYFKAVRGLTVDISRTLTATVGAKKNEVTGVVHVAVRRPNLAFVTWERTVGTQSVPIGGTLASDGKNLYVYIPLLRQYTSCKAPADLGALFSSKDAIPLVADAPIVLDSLLDNNPYDQLMDGVLRATCAGTELVNDARCYRVKLTQADFDVEIWVAAGDRPLLMQAVLDMTRSLRLTRGVPAGAQVKLLLGFRNWAINPDLPDHRFEFVPPEGAEKIASFSGPEGPAAAATGN